MALTAALIGAGAAVLGSTIGAIGSASNNKKAQKERTRIYDQSKSLLDTEYYRDPLSTVGNRTLLKSMDERMKDQTDALNNRMVAGGATIENQLAARESNNRTMSSVYSNLLQGEDARRAALKQQELSLDQNYSAGVQNSYYQNAQNWQAWGAQMGQAGMNLGTAGLLGGDTVAKNLFNMGKGLMGR